MVIRHLLDRVSVPGTGRASPQSIHHVAITGASSGLGAALAEAFAGPSRRLALSARNRDRLDRVAGRCRDRGAAVSTALVDVTDGDAVTAWLEQVDAAAPIDLVIANAGCTGGIGVEGGDEDPEAVRALFAVNLHGVVNTVSAVLPRMRARGHGRIAVISSLAAFCPSPGAAGYAASKAAVKSWAEALRSRVAADGVIVSVICPGFIDTPMTDRLLTRSKPGIMPAAAAARRIRTGLERGRPLIAFPLPVAIGARLLPWLPAPLADAVMRRFDYRVRPLDPQPGPVAVPAPPRRVA